MVEIEQPVCKHFYRKLTRGYVPSVQSTFIKLMANFHQILFHVFLCASEPSEEVEQH